MVKNINPKSVLFLYEGETEKEFYDKIFEKYIPNRKIRINFGNLKGVYNLNKKVKSKIEDYLLRKDYNDCKNIYVFVAYDREGDRNTQSILDVNFLKKEFISKKSRIKQINEIIATQDLESWFFYDIDNIYSFLKIPKSKRTKNKYSNIEATNNRLLSDLFHKNGKHYQKGKRVSGFIDSLNLEKIYENVIELKNSIEMIMQLQK